MQKSRLAQIVLNGWLATAGGRGIKKFLHCGWSRIRRILIACRDPLVAYNMGGTDILIPLSSNLPLHLKVFPQYSMNISRIVGHVRRKYSDLTLIDIGANIGDTAALMRGSSTTPVLCIEGADRFSEILQHNVRSLGNDVFIEECFVGDVSSTSSARVDAHRGTARIVETKGGSKVTFKTLAEILDNHPRFAKTKFIKIDTDGYDCRILKGNAQFLKQLKPVLFFEYDPYLFRAAGDDGFAVFDVLRNAGYRLALIYENIGDYLLMADLNNRSLLEDIDAFFTGRHEQRYCDICVFHEEDVDLCHAVREAEIEFFRRFRQRQNSSA